MGVKTKAIGDRGEAFIAQEMENRGFIILARNYATRQGEIDIIAQKENVIAFVEVKTRHNAFFDVTEVITLSKQKKMMKVAKAFLAQHTDTDAAYRFDVAILEHHTDKPTITYIPNAFYGYE
jgi:putative endonuclease